MRIGVNVRSMCLSKGVKERKVIENSETSKDNVAKLNMELILLNSYKLR